MLIAGPSYMPPAYRDTPLARLLPFDVRSAVALSRPRQAAYRRLRRAADRARPGQPRHATGRHARRNPATFGRTCRRCTGCWNCRELKPGVRVLAEHPTRTGPDGRRLPVFVLQYVGAGKVAVPCHRRDLAMALPRRRRLLRPLLDANHPLSLPGETGRCRPLGVILSSDRREYRPGRAGAAAGAVCRRTACAGRRRRRDGCGRAVGATDATIAAASHGGRPRRFRGRARAARRRELSCMDRCADVAGPVAGRRFHRDSAARRVRPSAAWTPPRCSRLPPEQHRRTLLHVSRRPIACLADLPPGRQVPDRIAAAAAALESLARADVVSAAVDRRMDTAKSPGNGSRILDHGPSARTETRRVAAAWADGPASRAVPRGDRSLGAWCSWGQSIICSASRIAGCGSCVVTVLEFAAGPFTAMSLPFFACVLAMSSLPAACNGGFPSWATNSSPPSSFCTLPTTIRPPVPSPCGGQSSPGQWRRPNRSTFGGTLDPRPTLVPAW